MQKITKIEDYYYYKLAEVICYTDTNTKFYESIVLNPNINIERLTSEILNLLEENASKKQLSRSGKTAVYSFFKYLVSNINTFSHQTTVDYKKIIEILNDLDNSSEEKNYYLEQSLFRGIEDDDLFEEVKKSLYNDWAILLSHTNGNNLKPHRRSSILKQYSYDKYYLGSLKVMEYQCPELYKNGTFRKISLEVLKNNRNILNALKQMNLKGFIESLNYTFIMDNMNLTEALNGKRSRK